MNKIKGFKIDVDNQTITEVEYDCINGSSYEYLKSNAAPFSGIITISGEILKDNINNICYVDDEGLLHAKEEINNGFILKSNCYRDNSLLLGNAVIEGVNAEGASISSNLTLEEVKERVEFKKFSLEEITQRMSNFQILSL
jgi:hypothetical protein